MILILILINLCVPSFFLFNVDLFLCFIFIKIIDLDFKKVKKKIKEKMPSIITINTTITIGQVFSYKSKSYLDFLYFFVMLNIKLDQFLYFFVIVLNIFVSA